MQNISSINNTLIALNNMTYLSFFSINSGESIKPYKLSSQDNNFCQWNNLNSNNFITTTNETIIDELDDKLLYLKKPIKISIKTEEDGYILYFNEAGIATSGDTFFDAYAWMRETIVSKYRRLKSQRRILGPILKKTLNVLEDYIAEIR